MNGEWQVCSLREINITLIDCDHRTPPAASSGYPYVAIPQVKDGRINLSDTRLISEEHFADWTKKANPQPFDVVLSRRCNPGESAFVEPNMKFALGQNLVLLRSDGQKLHKPFLRWLVRGPEWWGQVERFINVGAVFNSLKCADIPKFELTIPPLKEQRRIAYILSTLDDKIELNRQINQTLEAMAQALFKSWFVDFEPVKAKIAAIETGEDPTRAAMRTISGKTDEELDAFKAADLDAYSQLHATASLFPDELEESELGHVPKGWEVGKLEDLLVLQRGFDLPSQEREDGVYPIIAASGPSGFHSKYMVKAPGVVTGRSGVLGKVFLVLEDYWPLNTSLWVKQFKKASPHFAYYILKQIDFKIFNAGSAVPSLNRNHVHCLAQLLPDNKSMSLFESIVSEYHKKIKNNEIESQSLANLRDTLLPKLLSGEILVGEAENEVLALA
ncbi:restriction endonuclease subunit S [Spirosoma fluminis]